MRPLGLLLLLLALGLFAGLRAPAPLPGDTAPPPAAQPWSEPAGIEPRPGALALITQRSLFRPGRRPPVEVPPEEPVPAAPRVQLSAVSVSSEIRVAVIRDLDSGRTRRIREGEKLNEWTVKRVQGDEIVLQWKERQTVIPLSGRE